MPKRLNTSDIGAGTCALLWRRPLAALLLLLLLPSLLPGQTHGPSGPSLRLVEKGRFLELPPDVFNGLTETTVEAWVKWMPEMDGFGFMQELRARPDCRSIPVIVITAKHLTDDDRRRLNGEVARILQKATTSTEDLLAEIRSLLPTPGMS